MVYLDTMPLRFGHFRVLITTAMGQFLGAAVADAFRRLNSSSRHRSAS